MQVILRMVHDDFDIERLANYLHLTVGQVTRLADRGQLPGRKVGGQWRFSPAEIHHWLEDRIGISDDGQLARVENVLYAADESAEEEVPAGQDQLIADLLHNSTIALPLVARTRRSVIAAMTQLGVDSGLLWDGEKMAEAIHSREKLHPTALDSGVALLHPRRPMPTIIAEPFLALGRTSQGVPFGGRGGLTDIFFLICSTDDRGHLRVLARLSRLIGDTALLDLIRENDDAKAVHEAIRSAEFELST